MPSELRNAMTTHTGSIGTKLNERLPTGNDIPEIPTPAQVKKPVECIPRGILQRVVDALHTQVPIASDGRASVNIPSGTPRGVVKALQSLLTAKGWDSSYHDGQRDENSDQTYTLVIWATPTARGERQE